MSLAPRQRRLAFAALVVATVIAVLDISAINLALPSIAADLGLGLDQVLWLSKANLLACALLILPCAALGDILGHRRLFKAGLLLFASMALVMAVSSDLRLLIAARALQGCAAAAIMCSSLVLLREIFPAHRLGAALGLNALFVAVATTLGPGLSGLILTLLAWRWIFALSLPLALVALALGRAQLPEKRVPNSRFDSIGAACLAGSALSSIAWYLGLGGAWPGLLAALLGVCFVLQQHRCRWPLLPLSLFDDLRFDYALGASVCAFIGQSSVFILLPLVFQQSMGYDALTTAALFMPWPLMTAVVGPWAGRYADHRNPRAMASCGLAAFALGLAALASMPACASPIDILWRTAICGVGFGLFQSPNNREILTHIAPVHAARAAALLSAGRLLGQAIGSLLVGWACSAQEQGATGKPSHDAFALLIGASAALQIVSLATAFLLPSHSVDRTRTSQT